MGRPPKIHIFGASGSGTTTLGILISERLRLPFLDADDFFWKKTDPPYLETIAPRERVAKIGERIQDFQGWVLSGSICGWGDPLMEEFTLAVFMELDPAVRIERLFRREADRYGDRIRMGGDMHQQHVEFVKWAKRYDTASEGVRCRPVHLKWMSRLECPVVRVNSSESPQALTEEIIRAIA